jgi:tetratricopeptide (TPR) repeat protein
MAPSDSPPPGPDAETRQGSPPEPDVLLDDLWERGDRPDVRSFLAGWRGRDLQPEDILAVFRVDQRRRWLSGQRVEVAGYLSCSPSLLDDREALFELIYNEILIREELGERPDPRDYAATFPHLADRLRIQLEVHEALFSTELVAVGSPPPHEAEALHKPSVPGYEVLGEIGRGGMGVVYRARQLRPDRLVALKMILDGRFASERDLLRFANEAEIVAALAHPNIVPVLEVGHHEGLHYFSMPLLNGGSLAKSQPDPTGDVRAGARLVAEVAAAVHHAHERGVLHRDLKPANILLDDEGRPHVTDFGLAKRVLDPNGLTETGAIMGSPGYMAPEQASGDPAAVTTASDVYGLGAVLYALLTGRAPFGGGSVPETIARLRDELPEPPSRINPAVPRPLERICLVCLEKEPARRYPSANALAADLRRWLAGEPVLAQPEPLTLRTRRWVRRRRTVLAAAAAAMTMAIVGLTVALILQARANRELSAANARERALSDLAMDAIKHFYTGVSGDLLLKEPQFHRLRTNLLEGARGFYGKLETQLEGQSDPRSRQAMVKVYDDLAELTKDIGTKASALDLFHRELALRRELARGMPVDAEARKDMARCLLQVGALQFEAGNMSEAMAAYDEARALLERTGRSSKPPADVRDELAICDQLTGDLFAATERTAEALTSYRSARSLREAMGRDNPLNGAILGRIATSDLAIANLYKKMNQPHDAIEAFERARAVLQSLVEADPTVVEHRRLLAYCENAVSQPLHEIGRTDDALRALESARALLETIVSENPSVTEFRRLLAYGDSQIAYLLCDAGRTAEALAPYERARESLDALAQAQPTVIEVRKDRARCYGQIGQVLRATGRPVEALASSREARAMLEALIDDDHEGRTGNRSELAVTLVNIGGIMRQTGQLAEASTTYREAVAVLDALPSRAPEDHYNRACARACLAAIAGQPGSDLTAAEGLAACDRAMEDLRLAAAFGFRRMRPLVASDRDLDPLRSRPDFQSLSMDMAFPADPFAR